MKNYIYKFLLFFIFYSISIYSNGQQIISSTKDAKSLLEAYLSPLGNGLGSGLNNGWYNTGKPHKLGGFDVSININTVVFNDNQKFFDINELENFRSSATKTPTIVGNGEGANVTYEGLENDINFTMPNQNSFSFLPVPAANASVGLFKKTEIGFRYIPKYTFEKGFIGKGSIGLWGLSIKHDLLQWVPGIGNIIPLDLSLQYGLTNLNTNFQIESQGVKQSVNLKTNASTLNLILSKKLLILTAHGSIGYNFSSTDFSTGETQINFGDGDNSDIISIYVPADIEFKTQNSFRFNVGLRTKITLITLYANYTYSEYPVLTVGTGIALR